MSPARLSGRVRLAGRRPLTPLWRSSLRRLLSRALEDGRRAGAVSVVFVGDDEIRELNRRFLGEDRATDVLAFDLSEDGSRGDPHPDDLLGEIVVSVETARREASARGVPLDRELALYALHGLLHLLGLDDADPASRRRMRRAEARRLALWDEAAAEG